MSAISNLGISNFFYYLLWFNVNLAYRPSTTYYYHKDFQAILNDIANDQRSPPPTTDIGQNDVLFFENISSQNLYTYTPEQVDALRNIMVHKLPFNTIKNLLFACVEFDPTLKNFYFDNTSGAITDIMKDESDLGVEIVKFLQSMLDSKLKIARPLPSKLSLDNYITTQLNTVNSANYGNYMLIGNWLNTMISNHQTYVKDIYDFYNTHRIAPANTSFVPQPIQTFYVTPVRTNDAVAFNMSTLHLDGKVFCSFRYEHLNTYTHTYAYNNKEYQWSSGIVPKNRSTCDNYLSHEKRRNSDKFMWGDWWSREEAYAYLDERDVFAYCVINSPQDTTPNVVVLPNQFTGDARLILLDKSNETDQFYKAFMQKTSLPNYEKIIFIHNESLSVMGLIVCYEGFTRMSGPVFKTLTSKLRGKNFSYVRMGNDGTMLFLDYFYEQNNNMMAYNINYEQAFKTGSIDPTTAQHINVLSNIMISEKCRKVNGICQMPYFAFTSPNILLSSNDAFSTYIGVGHAKLEYSEKYKPSIMNSMYLCDLLRFKKYGEKYVRHGGSSYTNDCKGYQYYMFFYKFTISNSLAMIAQIDGSTSYTYSNQLTSFYMSKAFIPKIDPYPNDAQRYSLVFPLGLNRVDRDTIMVSGGEGDVLNFTATYTIADVVNSCIYDIQKSIEDYEVVPD